VEQAKNSSPVLPGDGKGALTPERLRQIGKETGLQHFLVNPQLTIGAAHIPGRSSRHFGNF